MIFKGPGPSVLLAMKVFHPAAPSLSELLAETTAFWEEAGPRLRRTGHWRVSFNLKITNNLLQLQYLQCLQIIKIPKNNCNNHNNFKTKCPQDHLSPPSSLPRFFLVGGLSTVVIAAGRSCAAACSLVSKTEEFPRTMPPPLL